MFSYLKLQLSGMWTHLQPVLVLFITAVGKEILLSALGAVQKANGQVNMSSSQKRDYAAQLIKAEVNNASTKAVNLAIEIAVNKLNQ